MFSTLNHFKCHLECARKWESIDKVSSCMLSFQDNLAQKCKILVNQVGASNLISSPDCQVFANLIMHQPSKQLTQRLNQKIR